MQLFPGSTQESGACPVPTPEKQKLAPAIFTSREGQQKQIPCPTCFVAERLSPEVGANVVTDHEASRKEEPENAVEDVVSDELDLGHDHTDRHDRPCQLADLDDGDGDER